MLSSFNPSGPNPANPAAGINFAANNTKNSENENDKESPYKAVDSLFKVVKDI
jgi:hypothetical protein